MWVRMSATSPNTAKKKKTSGRLRRFFHSSSRRRQSCSARWMTNSIPTKGTSTCNAFNVCMAACSPILSVSPIILARMCLAAPAPALSSAISVLLSTKRSALRSASLWAPRSTNRSAPPSARRSTPRSASLSAPRSTRRSAPLPASRSTPLWVSRSPTRSPMLSLILAVIRSTTRSAALKAVFSIHLCSSWCLAVWNSSPSSPWLDSAFEAPSRGAVSSSKRRVERLPWQLLVWAVSSIAAFLTRAASCSSRAVVRAAS
mmetsp:Transcript_52823/g.123162  ORF Transcript_52823/g.123162 Transcript_52823/m.123162 type:complete len:259 (-) Transcript_52823:94-870(-)